MYSDQYDGQNRNIVSLMCQYIVSSPEYSVKKIYHTFLINEHSYLLCNQNYGLVENKKILFLNIFILEDSNNIILEAH